jgi:2'-hydroxyisoflavone reductase
MKILIIGGTIFLGKHLVTSALSKGHQVTIFNRGIHNPDLFPEVERIRGDRNKDLDKLNGKKWDAVIDTCGYIPGIVRKSAEALKNSTELYIFISSISVYKDFSKSGINEDSETGTLKDESTEEITGETYGPLKAHCEKEVRFIFKDKSLIIRPGLIVGPDDPTDRFTYIPHRIHKGGEVLVPDTDSNAQFIDVRDLAKWIIKLAEERRSGVFNATGPENKLKLRDIFLRCNEINGNKAQLISIEEKFLLENGVQPWMEIPLWVPAEDSGINEVDISRALNAGLKFRKPEDTLRDTLEWDLTRNEDYKLKAGLSEDKEASIITKWRANNT